MVNSEIVNRKEWTTNNEPNHQILQIHHPVTEAVPPLLARRGVSES